MNSPVLPHDAPFGAAGLAPALHTDAGPPAVAWSAVFAGAAAAAALSMILLILGVGLGLSSVSPWAASGISAATFGISTIGWLSFTQLAASGMGGYLAGRLRHRWLRTDPDEVYFRDTAHGFLSWAVASLVTAAALTSAVGGIVGGGVQAGASLAGTASAVAATGAAGLAQAGSNGGAADAGPAAYFTDMLFRSAAAAPATGAAQAPGNPASAADAAPGAAPATAGSMSPAAGVAPAEPMSPAALAEVARIMGQGAASGTLPAEDVRYLAQLVSQRTGLSQAEAERRVNETFTRLKARAQEAATTAREAADKARKASAAASMWLFISLLLGAFVASFAALHGGRRRDLV